MARQFFLTTVLIAAAALVSSSCSSSSSSRSNRTDASASDVSVSDDSAGDAVSVPTCSDGIKNGTEIEVDCGGSCTPCGAAPTCTDGEKNGAELGVDCGGGCPDECVGCTDLKQNGSETGIDCGGDCPNACPIFYHVTTDRVFSYPDLASLLSETSYTEVGANSDLAGDIDAFAYGGKVYRVTEAGQLWSYPDVAALVAGNGTLEGTNAKLTDFQDFLVSVNGSKQTWIYAVKPVGDLGVCGIHSFESPSAMVGDDFSYHGSVDVPCADYEEFFLSTAGDRGAGSFYVSKSDGSIFHYEPSGPPTNKSWNADFDYGTAVDAGKNSDSGSERNVGIFLF